MLERVFCFVCTMESSWVLTPSIVMDVTDEEFRIGIGWLQMEVGIGFERNSDGQ